MESLDDDVVELVLGGVSEEAPGVPWRDLGTNRLRKRWHLRRSRIFSGGDTMLKRGAVVLGVLALLGGWVVGTGSLMAAGAPKAYVGLFKDDAVAVIDTAQNKVLSTISVPKGPHGLVITPDGRKVYVSSDGAATVSVIDTAADRVGVSIDVGANPHGLALSGDGSRVLVSGWGSNQVLDTATNQIVAQIPVGASPHYAPFTPDGRWALAVVQGPGELGILDTASNTLAGTVAVGKAPHWSTSSSDGRMAYVTNEGSNDTSVVDLASRMVTATISVGNAPRKIAVQPVSGPTATTPAPERAAVAPSGKTKSITLSGVSYADHGTKDVRNMAKLELEADDYYFSPTFLRGKPGQKLTLLVESEASTLHNIRIAALGIDKDIPPKGKVQFDVTFPASGVLAFSCKFHGPLGMNGQLLAGDTAPGGAR